MSFGTVARLPPNLLRSVQPRCPPKRNLVDALQSLQQVLDHLSLVLSQSAAALNDLRTLLSNGAVRA